MKTHELKIRGIYLFDIICNGKRFELRKDDRGFKVGDTLFLREVMDGVYTGRAIATTITYILRDCPEYGLQEGYCILGFDKYDLRRGKLNNQ